MKLIPSNEVKGCLKIIPLFIIPLVRRHWSKQKIGDNHQTQTGRLLPKQILSYIGSNANSKLGIDKSFFGEDEIKIQNPVTNSLKIFIYPVLLRYMYKFEHINITLTLICKCQIKTVRGNYSRFSSNAWFKLH